MSQLLPKQVVDGPFPPWSGTCHDKPSSFSVTSRCGGVPELDRNVCPGSGGEENAGDRGQRSTGRWSVLAFLASSTLGRSQRRSALSLHRHPGRSRKRPILGANSRRLSYAATARCQAGIRLIQLRGGRGVRRAQPPPGLMARGQPQRTMRWYPKSTPQLRIDSLRILLDTAVDALRFLAQVP